MSPGNPFAIALVLLTWCGPCFSQAASDNAAATRTNAAGTEACSSCHAEIANAYRKTAMATASGPARDGLSTGEFEARESRVHYRVYEQEGKVWMSYERSGKDEIHGKLELPYFIGSGRKGRTYLFSHDGFWFETPINWYSQEKRWNMTPAYTEAVQIPLNLPAYVDCLNCHTSGMQPPVAGTDSGFAGKPFLHGGITCQRCHGPGSDHAGGQGPILNPAKLSAEQRDSICMECHFEGTVAVQQPGKQVYQFQPGDRLSDYVHYFVLTDNPRQQTPQALSQFEALSQSRCQRSSGDKMWCGSCHDVHREPAAEERVAYYRGKCIACHGDAFASKHHADKPDCVHCHMPALPSKDVAHTEATDHRILRYPNSSPLPQLQVRGKPLTPFPASSEGLVTTRDYALAWETLAQRGIEGASRVAEDYLEQAVKDRPDDPVLLAATGFVEQRHGRVNQAREFYERALKIDPLANDAAADLGIIEAREGNLKRAVELWNAAFARVPNRSAIGMDLAMIFCAAGQRDIARKYLDRVLEFNPDYGKAKSLRDHLNQDPVECKP